MKQPISQLHTAVAASKIPAALSRRRLMGHVVLGSAAALMLSACGGGSSDSTDDGTSAQEAKLIAAYDKLEQGMDWTDVEALVGFPANNTRGTTILVWVVGTVRLTVVFRSSGSRLIADAELRVGSNVPVGKVFE